MGNPSWKGTERKSDHETNQSRNKQGTEREREDITTKQNAAKTMKISGEIESCNKKGFGNMEMQRKHL